jgi:hypothetical protein
MIELQKLKEKNMCVALLVLTALIEPLWLPIFAFRMAGPAAGMYCTKMYLLRLDVVF